jgi:hypothetical protein
MFNEGSRISEIDATFVNGVDRPVVEARARRALGSEYVVGGIESGSALLASLKVSQFIFNMFGVFAGVADSSSEHLQDCVLAASISCGRSELAPTISDILAGSLIQGALNGLGLLRAAVVTDHRCLGPLLQPSCHPIGAPHSRSHLITAVIPASHHGVAALYRRCLPAHHAAE